MKSIKEICKELNITSRTIRHYEEYFNLSSERKSNVRYYDEEEFKKIKIIITLRKLDFPLHRISDILKELDNNTIINNIETEKEKYREQIKNSSRKILLLEDLKKQLKTIAT